MKKYIIPEEFIETLRNQANIIDVISEYVPLKKRGRNYWGCCPFHQEKTPSFSVAPEKNFFYCYGCQAGGDIFRFIMRIESLGFTDSVKLLAQKLNISIPEQEKSAVERQLEQEREAIYRANELARDFFLACMTKSALGINALAYLTERGISVEQAQELRLGFAPDAWDKLALALQKKGIEAEIVVKAGLAIPRTQTGIYDRFRNRIMFPIEDIRGRVIGFGGRVMDNSQPKYLNSPESPVFNKRRVLYNISRAYRHIKETGRAIVVEGYMDAISLSSHGIRNVVASLGTSFTPEQSRTLLQYAPEIVFAYDGDAAGQNATQRALSIVRTSGATVKVASFPGGKDPDEVLRKFGVEVVQKRLNDAMGLLEFQMEQVFLGSDYSDLAGKVAVVGKAVPFLAMTDNQVEVDVHIAALAEKLAIDESSIRAELRRFRGSKQEVVPKAIGIVNKRGDSKIAMAEDYLLKVAIDSSAGFRRISETLKPDMFQNRSVAEAIWACYEKGLECHAPNLLSQLDEAGIQYLSRLLQEELQESDAGQALEDCIRTICLTRLNEEYEVHRLCADEMLRRGDLEYVQELTNAQRILTKISDLTKS